MTANSPQSATAPIPAHTMPGAATTPRGLQDAATAAIAAAVLGGQLYRKPTVRTITGLSDSTIDRMIRSGTFPQPVKLGPRSVAWRSADIAVWMASLAAVE